MTLVTYFFDLLVRPETIVFGADLCFTAYVFYCPAIFELGWLIVAKFCTVVGSWLDFVMQVQKFGIHFKKI